MKRETAEQASKLFQKIRELEERIKQVEASSVVKLYFPDENVSLTLYPQQEWTKHIFDAIHKELTSWLNHYTCELEKLNDE